jgi:hypothetical protein
MIGKRTYSIDAPDQQRLKIARAEIEAVLRKHDLGGAVVLHTPGMTEFFYDIRPSYSCAWIDDAAQTVRIKSKLADYSGDQAAQRHDQAATANMLHGLGFDLGKAAVMFLDVAKHVDRVIGAEHTGSVFVSDANEARRQ